MVLEMFDKLQFGEVCLVLIRMILTTSSHTSLYKSIYTYTATLVLRTAGQGQTGRLNG